MLEDKLIKILEMLESGILLTSQQLPVIAKDFLEWKFYQSFFFLTIGTFLSILAIMFWKKGKKAICRGEEEESAGLFVGFLFSFALSGIIILYNIHGLIKLTIAPRVYLIEYIRCMIG